MITLKLYTQGYVRYRFCSARKTQIKMARWPKTDKLGGKMYREKYSLLNDITRWCSCSVVSRGCVNRIRLWPLRRDDHPGVLIGAGGTRRSDWPPRVLANNVSTRIDLQPTCEKRSITRVQGQVVASCYTAFYQLSKSECL